jgi:GntR family transcriptional regulator
MRFWITKNSELPVREQLVRQITLAILSEDLPSGDKLPSIRALARRYKIHSNTVSAAYHDLLNRGWLELRRGSGLYVRPLNSSGAAAQELDTLLAGLLREARRLGHEPHEVLHRLEQMILPRNSSRIAIIDTDPGMGEILRAEIAERSPIPAEVVEIDRVATISGDCLAVALPTRAAMVRERLPRGVPFMILRLRSVRGSLEMHTRPAPDAIAAIVSRSADFRRWAHAMLIAVGLDPACLLDVDTALADWQQRACTGKLVIADVVAARNLPASCQVKLFRVIADACLDEIVALQKVSQLGA